MTEEIDFAGVFVPTFVVSCVVALAIGVLLSKMMARLLSPDFRRFVWHAPLFDFAMFIVFVGISYLLLGTLLP
jgi:uncharacterized protein DUF1656